MSGKIEVEGLSNLGKELIRLGQEQFPKQTKNFMQRAGNRQLKIAKAQYKADLSSGGKARYKEVDGKRKRTDLIGGLSRGSAYKYKGNEFQVRVKNKAPHAHLFEHGHATKAKNPNKQKWVRGRNTMGKAARQFEKEYGDMAEAFVDELLASGLK